MNELPVKVLRIDSRLRASGTSSDFSIVLPRALTFPEDAVCYVSAVSVPFSWYNVSESMNDVLFCIERKGATVIQACRAIALPKGQYTALSLPTMLQTSLNTGSTLTGMTYQVTYDSTRGTISIRLVNGTGSDATARFQLPSETELMSVAWRSANWVALGGGTAATYDIRDPDSIGDLLRLPETSISTTSLESGLVNVSPIDVLYLRCSLNNFSTLGCRGEADWIARIPVDVSYGFTIHYEHSGLLDDHFGCGGQSGVQELRFSLVNSKNTIVDLNGAPMSVELVFSHRQPG